MEETVVFVYSCIKSMILGSGLTKNNPLKLDLSYSGADNQS